MAESAGQQEALPGRLARVIATRGGLAPPEEPFVIEHREALIYMLCEAAELEHGIMCQYLYAAFSMKQDAGEGLTDDQVTAVRRWRKRISHVAVQEMLHLALVQNLLSAVGAAPHLSRPNFPQPASHYPAGVNLTLLPFGEAALRHFMFLERPEGMALNDAPGLAAVGRATPAMQAGDIVPRGQDFATVGHLYRSIEAGIEHLARKYGERWLFVGPPRAQATQEHFGWPELIAVTDVASAKHAIGEILEQGEGPRGDWRNAHFGQFVEILDELEQFREADRAFDPVRPVLPLNVRPSERDPDVPLVTDPLAQRVMDLFNVCYEILLLMLQRFFAHTEETGAQLKALADGTYALMEQALKPLGDLITRLPAGPEYPGRTTGPSFELFYESDYVLPHREAAWILLAERIEVAAAFCDPADAAASPEVTRQLTAVRESLSGIARALGAHLPARTGFTQSGLARDARPKGPGDRPAQLERARDLCQAAAGRSPADDISAALDGIARRIPGEPVPEAVWSAAADATRLLARLANAAPPELLEAVAALQLIAMDLAPDTAARAAELAKIQRGLIPRIVVADDGPYLVTNAASVRGHLGESLEVPPQLALCRCGESGDKPFCDGSHARAGFSGAKDPGRVPDRRDSYPGAAVTILDNRGICQHSGFCTSRLPAVFRAGAEPFVAPGGGRMDEIVRAVRDCPSGALGLAYDGIESRYVTDWHGRRQQAIEISLDGPYRVSGGIPLADAAGEDIPRASGSSREHYALCRCGHSRNKPFCSGMHWYVQFRDPAPAADPSLFEWAGGLPALTRMTRMLYESLVPADDLLAPAFADLPPGAPEREAAWLAEAFGGPHGDGVTALAGRDLTPAQRRQWFGLALRAADLAALPDDPPFRAALAGFLDWASRTPADPGGRVPSWDWGPAGRPDTSRQEADDSKSSVTLPGPEETVGFDAHIRPLFRERDRTSMRFAFDLWSRDDVRQHAAEILRRLRDGSMPCDGTWPQAWTEVFARWTDSGFQP